LFILSVVIGYFISQNVGIAFTYMFIYTFVLLYLYLLQTIFITLE